jgi:hypothetical protein
LRRSAHRQRQNERDKARVHKVFFHSIHGSIKVVPNCNH